MFQPGTNGRTEDGRTESNEVNGTECGGRIESRVKYYTPIQLPFGSESVEQTLAHYSRKCENRTEIWYCNK